MSATESRVHTSPFLRRVAAGLCGVAIASSAAAQAGDGFLFEKPRGTIAFRAGYAAANAGSDLFSFTTELLTLNRRDFSGPSVEVDATRRLGARTNVVFSALYSRARKRSEFRDFVDQDDKPIEQTTQFERLPLTVGVRSYLVSPGRGIGNFAWVPARIVPFLGFSAGMVWYRFRQSGDFIDFTDNSVFTSTLESTGWSPVSRALAGVEYTVSSHVSLSVQGNYLRAKGTLGTDFAGFDRLDLSGFSTSIGLATRF
jgi:hypothetical protein